MFSLNAFLALEGLGAYDLVLRASGSTSWPFFRSFNFSLSWSMNPPSAGRLLGLTYLDRLDKPPRVGSDDSLVPFNNDPYFI